MTESTGDDTATAAPADPDAGLIPRETSEFDRGLSYFDAIYGFAVTLLIANVDAPEPDSWKSLDALSESGLGSQLFGVALSFVVICSLWRVNVRLVQALDGLNGPTMLANLAGCGLIILLPFTTQGISDPGSADYALPTAFYALNIACIAIAQIVMFQFGRTAGLERVATSSKTNALRVADASIAPLVFLLSIPVALAFGQLPAQLMWASLFVLLPISGKLTGRMMGS